MSWIVAPTSGVAGHLTRVHRLQALGRLPVELLLVLLCREHLAPQTCEELP
jgi:hypothetical protein